MSQRLSPLLQPLNLVAIITIIAIGIAVQPELGDSGMNAWWLLGAFVAALLILDQVPTDSRWRWLLYLLQTLCAFTLIAIAPRTGIAPVLLVILIAELVMEYPLRVVVALAAAFNGVVYLLLVRSGHDTAWLQVVLYIGFQAFAALTTWYARSAEEARDRLAVVNADLLATRSLLADSVRERERLRVARELHDVVGHKLTALTLNLRILASDDSLPPRRELAQAQQLTTDLLTDIRHIVQAIRDERGFDLATALRALAAPLPRPALELRIAQAVHVTDPDTAETLLRIVQEALTNSARHADADRLRVSLDAEADGLRIHIEDDGRLKGTLREGNGLCGMRERIRAHGGRLRLVPSPTGALCIDAWLPGVATANASGATRG